MQGKGYGTDAVRSLVSWLFSDAGATLVHKPTVSDNVAMRTVAERLGFEAEGTISYEGLEFIFYVLNRERWMAGDR
jgi:RimJ/RimL family protein N-acetyltransferase